MYNYAALKFIWISGCGGIDILFDCYTAGYCPKAMLRLGLRFGLMLESFILLLYRLAKGAPLVTWKPLVWKIPELLFIPRLTEFIGFIGLG